jgi:hypothetical protein
MFKTEKYTYMKNKYTKITLLTAAMGMMLFASCGPSQELAYFKEAPRNEETEQDGQF